MSKKLIRKGLEGLVTDESLEWGKHPKWDRIRLWNMGYEEPEETYSGGTLPLVNITASVPPINTNEGKSLAKKMAQDVYTGKMLMKDVPTRYINYVDGEVRGAIPYSYKEHPGAVATGKAATGVIGGIALKAAAPALNYIFTPSSWAVKGKKIFDPFAGKMLDNTIKLDFVKEGIEGLHNQKQEGTLLTHPVETGFNTLMSLPALKAVSKLGVGAYKKLNKAQPIINEIETVAEPVVNAIKESAPPYEIQRYGGGYMLKSLTEGNPLERQLSKAGTISVNSIRAQAARSGKIDLSIIDKVLNSELFAGQLVIDYNQFRKAVQDELITFSRKPQNKYSAYGMDRLGFNVVNGPDGTIEYAYVPGISTNTFTLESPRIPQGHAAHYDPTTLMHSRTFTTPEEPDILYVLEGLSDAALHTLDPVSRSIVNDAKLKLSRAEQLLEDFRSFPEKYLNININEKSIENFINKQKSIIYGQKLRMRIFTGQEKYLFDNYLSKIIQENLKFASERGQTKMRYPTKDTAVKIEGFKRVKTVSPEHEQLLKDNQSYNILKDIISEDLNKLRFPEVTSVGDNSYLIDSKTGLTDIQIGVDGKPYRVPVGQGVDYHYIENVFDFGLLVHEMPKVETPKEWQDYENLRAIFESSLENIRELIEKTGSIIKYEGKSDFIPEHQTILRKYLDFPKLFQKLYKGQNVRTITDAKGNTWYEVDVPEDYLSREWLFKKGGRLNKKKLIRKTKKWVNYKY